MPSRIPRSMGFPVAFGMTFPVTLRMTLATAFGTVLRP